VTPEAERRVGGVIVSTIGCGEQGGVRRRGDSAVKVEIRAFGKETREGNDSRGEWDGVVVRKGEGASGEYGDGDSA